MLEMRGLAHFLRPGTIVYLFKMKKKWRKKTKSYQINSYMVKSGL